METKERLMFKDNPKFALQGDFNGVRIYTCVKESDYHTVRYIEALNWQTFASCGVTKDKLKQLTDNLLEICNDDKSGKTIRTDVASIAQLIQYAMKYPLEEHCGIQLGCMLSFAEWEIDGTTYSEDPNSIQDTFMRKKMDLALGNPDAYTFFLSWGIDNIPEYKTHFATLTDMNYFQKRKQAMAAILPEHLQHLMTS